ncbi:MAG: PQQ-binding-like beta-propeller repeat protein, partial [Anaerolineae bacterium]|nr:PQQ-binding-like beta-propeller repeat protein [Anaerolineae bacterium]
LTRGDVRWEQRFPNAVMGGVTRVSETRVLLSLPSLGHSPGESALVAVDATGRILWRTTCDVDQISAPSGCGETAAVTGNARAVVLVDAATGEQRVRAKMPVDVALAAPACDGTMVYVPCRAPALLALSTTGDLLWRFDVEGMLSGVQINQTPTVVGPNVIAVLSSGAVLALARESGELVWETHVGPRGKQLTAPVTDGRRLYVGARDGVYALSLRDGEQQWVFRTGSYVSAPPVMSDDVLCIAGNDRHLYGVDPRNGGLLWQITMSQETKLSPALAEGDTEGPYVVVVDCTGGVSGLTYPVAAADHEAAGRWRKAALVWEAQGDPRHAAQAWLHFAAALGEDPKTVDTRAQSYVAAAQHFASIGAVGSAVEARRRYAQVLGLPYIVLDVQHDGLLLDAWSRLRLVIQNGGFGRARDVVIRVAGEQFEGQIAETQMVAALPPEQSVEQELDVKPLEHGDSVPLRVQISYLDQNGEPHRREETIYLAVAKKAAKRVPGSLRVPGDAAAAAWTGDPLPTVDLEVRVSRGSRDYAVELTLNGGQVFSGGHLSKSILEWSTSGDATQDGVQLFESLFHDGAVRKGWHVARGLAQQQGALRRIRLRIDPDVAELHRLPWELLHDDEVMLSACESTPFSRYLPVERPWGGAVAERPIRVLAAIANPDDLAERYDVPPLNVKMERFLLANAFAGIDPHQIRLEFLPPPVTLERLSRAMLEGYHWLHLVGHGRYNARQERMDLLLEDAHGSTRAIASHLLCRMLAHQGAQPQLVFLSVCQSAVGPDGHVLNGLAAKLVEVGVPAVVAMRDRVQMRAAQQLARTFYEGLARHGMADRALNQARDALLAADLPGVQSPVLYMRLSSGRLWDVT